VNPNSATPRDGAARFIGVSGLALALAAGGGARAATVVNAANNCGISDSIAVCADFSESGLLSFDLTWKSVAPVAIGVQIDAAEATADVLAFNGQQMNNTGQSFELLQLHLEQADFDPVGSALDALTEPVPVHSPSSTEALIEPGPYGQYLELGNVAGYGDPGAVDWKIGVPGLTAGQSFVMGFVPVPEADSASQGVAAALVVLGAACHRRARPANAASSAL
jgi:hypothetical protein